MTGHPDGVGQVGSMNEVAGGAAGAGIKVSDHIDT